MSNDSYISTITDETKSIPKQTIYEEFMHSFKENPSFTILKYKSNGKAGDFDRSLSMQKYYEEIMRTAKSFVQLGVEPQKTVCIMGFNSPEWFFSELGAIFIGSIASGIYSTNNAETCEHILTDSHCQVLVLENQRFLDRLRPILTAPEVMKNLKAVIIYGDQSLQRSTSDNNNIAPIEIIDEILPVYDWSDFVQLGIGISDEAIKERAIRMKPDDCCLLIYTSGTTGNPKGAIITHDNLIYNSYMTRIHNKLDFYQHRIISFLPLSHVAANMGDIISTFINRVTVYFAQPDALKGSLPQTMKEVRPTTLLTVPRLFEKIQEKIESESKKREQRQNSTKNQIQRNIINHFKRSGYRNSLRKMAGKRTDWTYNMANSLLFKKIKRLLGLDCCMFLGSVGAPIRKETVEFFMQLDLRIIQSYGLTECTGPQTFSDPTNMQPFSVGNPMVGTELKLQGVDEEGVGEICLRGRHVFKGYWNNEAKTQETIDEEGWLRTGDLGRLVVDQGGRKNDTNSFLYVTGRIKELIITAGGENIAPIPIEDRVKAELPFVSNVMLIGDKLKFLSCLLTFKVITNMETMEPTNRLLPDIAESFSKMIGHSVTTTNEIIELMDTQSDCPVKKRINDGIESVNKKAVSQAAKIQKWVVLPDDFSISGGEFSATMKLRRSKVCEKYEKEIQTMYK